MTRLILLAITLATPAAAQPCRVVDLIPAFAAFEARTAALAAPVRGQAFVSEALPGQRAFHLLPGLSPSPQSLLAPAERYFAGGRRTPGLRDGDPAATRAAAAALVATLPRLQADFLRTLPAFRCRAPIMVGVSLDRFDGLTIPEGRDARLLLGADMIARVHDAATRDVLVQHELFHLYHLQRLPGRPPAETPLWWGMWAEGLATYATEIIDPARTPDQLIWFPRGVASRAAAARPEIARAMLGQLDATGPAYAAFFGADGAPAGLPPRAGYYMGYLLARALGRDNSLDALARLPPARVRALVAAFLANEAALPPRRSTP